VRRMSIGFGMTPARRASDPPSRRLLRPLLATLTLAALAAAGWGSLGLVRGSAEVERGSRELAAYEQARAAVGAEASALLRYADGGARAAAISFLRARLRADEALAAAAAAAGGHDDAALALALAADHRRYAHAGKVLASPADARDAESSARLLRSRLTEAVEEARERTLVDAAADRREERLALLGLPLATVLASALLLLSSAARGRAAHQHELRRITHAALTDSLTGLRNHRAFHEDMKRAIEHRNASGAPFSLMMVDLDRLKEVNDTLGHQAGDERLRETADVLRAITRASDAAYRTGGDEFMVLLPDERALGALNLAQRLQELTAQPDCRVSMTIGVTESVGREPKDTLIRQADLALYEAKRTGRKVVAYSADLAPEPAQRRATVQALEGARVAAALARAVDGKAAGALRHCETVAELCVLIGRELGLDSETIARLRLAGLLHDVGTIGIPRAILQKAAPLDPVERAVVEAHPLVGENIAAAVGFAEEAEWIRHHHERYGGRGYPQGLRGPGIPLPSRIILVADAFEAITSGRPYRPPLPPEAALEELVRNAGTQLDPACVGALRRALSLGEGVALVA
jgi:diguanylate cyclase (GGDEF)-like protein